MIAVLIAAALSLFWLAYNAHEHVDQHGQLRHLDFALVMLAVVAALVAEGLHVDKQKVKRCGKR
jgi:hypothetical protein